MSETIAELLADEVRALTFAALPPEVIHQVKRSVMDIVACAMGGFSSAPSQIMQTLAQEAGGPPESTVFVTGVKTSCAYATLANGAMIRYLDSIDRSFLSKDARGNMGHHGESIGPILAVGERQHSTGQDVITAVVGAYEFLNKINLAIGGNDGAIRHGWTPESMRTGCVIALVTGKLIGLSADQIAHAVAIAGSFQYELGILNSADEQITMTRNLRFPYGAFNGIHAVMFARLGMKGPLRIFEGHHGIAEIATRGTMDLEALRRPREGWTILNTWMKAYSADGNIQGQIQATLELVTEHDVRPEDVAAILIRTNHHASRRQGNATTRRHPETKYSADHSSYYVTAVSIVDRAMGPEQYSDEKLRDRTVWDLCERISVEADPELEAFNAPAVIEITTKDGKKLRKEVLRPKGHPMNPMSDRDVEAKFRTLAGRLMDERRMSDVIRMIWDLDNLDDIGRLVELLVIPGHEATAQPH